jgi:hypothetical protein
MGLVLWDGIIGYLGGGLIGAAMALLLGGVTFADAWTSGIYKDRSRKSFLNISPMAWGVVMPMLFIAAYPLYLINRNKLRTKNSGNGFFVATIVIGAILFLLSMVGAFMVRKGVG